MSEFTVKNSSRRSRTTASVEQTRGLRPANDSSAVRDVVRSSGRPLDPETRKVMEARFGHDFSRIRIHDDAQAGASAAALRSSAYAYGDHVAFASGRYAPGTLEGGRLLAHELAHVVQQQRGGAAPSGLEESRRLERAADAAAAQVMSDAPHPVGVAGSSAPAVACHPDDKYGQRAEQEAPPIEQMLEEEAHNDWTERILHRVGPTSLKVEADKKAGVLRVWTLPLAGEPRELAEIKPPPEVPLSPKLVHASMESDGGEASAHPLIRVPRGWRTSIAPGAAAKLETKEAPRWETTFEGRILSIRFLVDGQEKASFDGMYSEKRRNLNIGDMQVAEELKGSGLGRRLFEIAIETVDSRYPGAPVESLEGMLAGDNQKTVGEKQDFRASHAAKMARELGFTDQTYEEGNFVFKARRPPRNPGALSGGQTQIESSNLPPEVHAPANQDVPEPIPSNALRSSFAHPVKDPRVREVIENFPPNSRPGSCATDPERLARKIFIATNGEVRPNVEYNANHRVVRLPDGTIVDPTGSQFAKLPEDVEPRTFVGDDAGVRAQLSDLVKRYGPNDHVRGRGPDEMATMAYDNPEPGRTLYGESLVMTHPGRAEYDETLNRTARALEAGKKPDSAPANGAARTADGVSQPKAPANGRPETPQASRGPQVTRPHVGFDDPDRAGADDNEPSRDPVRQTIGRAFQSRRRDRLPFGTNRDLQAAVPGTTQSPPAPVAQASLPESRTAESAQPALPVERAARALANRAATFQRPAIPIADKKTEKTRKLGDTKRYKDQGTANYLPNVFGSTRRADEAEHPLPTAGVNHILQDTDGRWMRRSPTIVLTRAHSLLKTKMDNPLSDAVGKGRITAEEFIARARANAVRSWFEARALGVSVPTAAEYGNALAWQERELRLRLNALRLDELAAVEYRGGGTVLTPPAKGSGAAPKRSRARRSKSTPQPASQGTAATQTAPTPRTAAKRAASSPPKALLAPPPLPRPRVGDDQERAGADDHRPSADPIRPAIGKAFKSRRENRLPFGTNRDIPAAVPGMESPPAPVAQASLPESRAAEVPPLVEHHEDGSAARRSRSATFERGDGRAGAVLESAASRKDAAGNEIASVGRAKGGLLANEQGIGAYGAAEGGVTRKSAGGFQTGVVGGLDGHIACRVEQVPDTDPARYRVVLTISLGGKAGITGGQGKDEGGATGRIGIEAQGNLTLTRKREMSQADSEAYLAALRSGDGTGLEFQIIRIGLKQGWSAARDAYVAATQHLPDPNQLKEGEAYQIDKSAALGVEVGLGAKDGGSGTIGVSAGYQVGHSSTLAVEKKDGKLEYTAEEGDSKKVSGGIDVGLGSVSGGFGASHTDTTALGHVVAIDPKDPEAAAMQAALHACHSQADLESLARKFPRAIKYKIESSGHADQQTASISVGVKATLSYGQQIDQRVVTDAQGRFVEKSVTGANSGGLAIGVAGFEIGASSVEQAAARRDAEGNASLDVSRADQSTNAAKWLAAHLPLAGDKEQGAIAKVTGGTDTNDRDLTGLGLHGDELAGMGAVALQDWSRWMRACPSPRQRQDWAAAGTRIRAANGDRGVVAEECARFVGKGNSKDVIERLVRAPAEVGTGARYEFPGGLAALKPTYDAMVVNDPSAEIEALAKGGSRQAAATKGGAMLAKLTSMYATISSASDFTQPAVQAEMLSAINHRREALEASLRVIAGGKAGGLFGKELQERYNWLAETCARYRQTEATLFDEIQRTFDDGSAGRSTIDNAIRIKQLRDLHAVWQSDYDEMAALAQENGFGKDRYWKLKPDTARFGRAVNGAPGPASVYGPETRDQRKKAPVVTASSDPVGDSFRELEKKSAVAAAGVQSRLASAKSRAYGAGNRLYAKIQSARNNAAVDAHNRGMELLRRADREAAQLPKNATADDWTSHGQVAVQDYESAAATFRAGLAL